MAQFQDTFTRKLASNRGNARIWLERKCLTRNGIHNGARFSCIISDDSVQLAFTADGDRKVAGTAERPIIDINTAKLNSVMTKTHYRVDVSPLAIVIITPIDNPSE